VRVNVERKGRTVHIDLDESELPLLRMALERALFIDTPPDQQGAILAFCTRALELLPARAPR